MSILINKDTKVSASGFTGAQVLSTLNRRLSTAPRMVGRYTLAGRHTHLGLWPVVQQPA